MAVAAAMVTVAANPILTFQSSTRGKRVQTFHSSSLVLSVCGTSRSHLYVLNPPHLGFASFSSWSGLKHLGIYFKRTESKEPRKCRRGLVVHASLFGVGAPEALVIGVVALLVFGPKGLAEVARTLGKTLRAFQPTIRELQDVSREFKSTLEREIGLDEVQSSLKSTYTPSPPVNEKSQNAVDLTDSAQPTSTPYSSEDLLKIAEEQLVSSTPSQLEEASAVDQSQTTEGKAEISSSNVVSIDSELPATQEASVTATPEVADGKK